MKKTTMEFIDLENDDQLDEIATAENDQVIFKHNTTCPISKSMLKEFTAQKDLLPKDTQVYVLDILNFRDISNDIADRFNIEHESPQLLFIKEGVCLYDRSLYDISAEDCAAAILENRE